jgi:PPOX class probable F420-dependent enzyme
VRPDASPQLTVVWYELRGDRVMINTRVGREKDRNIASNPQVALCVEDRYRAVTIDARVVEVVRDLAIARADILRLGVRYDGPAEARRQYDERWSRQRRVSYYLSIERVHAVASRSSGVSPRSISAVRDADPGRREGRRRRD